MSIIHGSWIVQSDRSYFFIWAETWRSLVGVESATTSEEIGIHPFALKQQELISLLDFHHLAGSEIADIDQSQTTETIVLPSHQTTSSKSWQPIFADELSAARTSQRGVQAPELGSGVSPFAAEVVSATLSSPESNSWQLYPWQVQGLAFTPTETLRFLQKLPIKSLQTNASYVGADLRFWGHVYRWSLDLIARGKFLPGIQTAEKGASSIWQPLLDSTIDQASLAKFNQLMPPACRAYQGSGDEPQSAQTLLLGFLGAIVDAQIRSWIEIDNNFSKTVTIQPWLRSLADFPTLAIDTKQRERIANALYNWTLPLQEYLVSSTNQNLAQNQYRTCFVLQPPPATTEGEQEDWQLQYYLQALDDPEFRVDAAAVWQHPTDTLIYQARTIDKPQETLLKGLGLATRLYAPIADSLQTSTPTYCPLNPIQVYEFIRSIAWQLQNNGLGIVLPPGLTSGESEQRLGIKITAEVSQKQGQRLSLQSLLQYKLEIAVGDQTVDKSEFERLLAQKSPVVEVNGQWLALQPADVKAAQAVLNEANEQTNLSVEDALRLSTGNTQTIAKLPVVSFQATGVLQELIANLTNNKSVEPVSKPKGLKGELRPYQARGVGWLSFLAKWGLGACLADDMGLGKTLQLIAFLLRLKEQDELKLPTLVVCPTSVLSNWEREVNKFAPSLSTLIHHGDRRSQGKTFANQVKQKNLVITSYSLVQRDIKTLEAVNWEGIVLDEAQNIKNPAAKQSQAVRQLQGGFRIALTGTPVENRLSELWSIIDFLNPGFLGTKAFFQKRFAVPIEKYGDRDSLTTLRSLVQPFILRRLKTDQDIIQDLPEKQEMNVYCGLSAEQAELYQQLVEASLAEIETSEGIKRRGLILTLLLRLKQLCNHPKLLEGKSKTRTKGKKKEANANGFGHRSGKMLRLEEMLEEVVEEGDRALIFTQFSEWGKLLKPYLESKLAREVIFLYGATRRQQRQEMIDRFQNDPNGPPIFILSLKAGGTGLNLTRANHVFHVDRWWNPAVENQATDRAFRIGQKRNVQVHKFVCTGTLEERINDIIESKKELAEQTVDAGEQWLTELDTNQLRNLLLLDRDAIIGEES